MTNQRPEPETLEEIRAEIATRLGCPVEEIVVSMTELGDPQPWAVWDPETGDILGAAGSIMETARAALEQVRQWDQNRTSNV